jgi:hypothetical protein
MPDCEPRLKQFFGIEFSALVGVQPIELRFHKPEPLLLRDLAVLIRIHEEEQLLDVLCRDRSLIGFYGNLLLPEGRAGDNLTDADECNNTPSAQLEPPLHSSAFFAENA